MHDTFHSNNLPVVSLQFIHISRGQSYDSSNWNLNYNHVPLKDFPIMHYLFVILIIYSIFPFPVPNDNESWEKVRPTPHLVS